MSKRTCRHIHLLIALSLICLVLGPAGESFAQTQYEEGTVTRAPWHDRYQRIEIDGVRYTFMPDAALHIREKNWQTGGYDEEPVSFHRILDGQKVALQAHGHRIFQLVILP